jgi:hypothetical protein
VMGRGDSSIVGCALACSKQAGTARRRGCRQQLARDQSERLISRSNFTRKHNGSSPGTLRSDESLKFRETSPGVNCFTGATLRPR